jgi:tricorn protease
MKRALLMIYSLLALSMVSITAQTEARLLRFPAIYSDKVVFTYAGDLYTVSSDGGIARKLTTHVGFEMFPKFSPDGKQIAFTGQYDGNTEVFLIPSEGGIPQRLTFTATLSRDDVSDRMGPNNIVMAWTPDGKNITYRSRKQSFNAFRGQLFNVSKEGGLSSELPLVNGGFCSYSPDGKQLAFNRVFREFRTWKYYQGGMADDIWVYDFASKKVENITNDPHQDIFPMWAGKEIFFLSDRDRTMNLFVYSTETKKISKVTNYTEYDIKFPSIGKDYIIYENGGFLYKMNVQTKTPEKLTIYIADDLLYSRNEIKDASQQIRRADLSTNGERIIFSARGEVFNVPSESGITTNLTQTPGVHERNASWSPDGKYVAYLSDASGEFEIYMRKQDGSEPAVQLTKGADTYIFDILWSPDSKKILFNDRKLRLHYLDVSTKETILVRQAIYGTIHSYDWSPDSKWIAYAENSDNDMGMIRLYNLASKSSYDVTDNWFNSSSPSFSNDGKYLLFESSRDFNPIYSNTEWNHAYVDMGRVYLVTLANATPSPFAPKNDEVKMEENPSPSADKDKDKADKKGKPEEKVKPEVKDIVIDTEGLKSRIIALPVSPSNYGGISCVDGIVYYNQFSRGSQGKLKMYDLKEQKETDLGSGLFYSLSSNYKKMLVRDGDRYGVIDLPKGPISLKETVDLSNMKVMVDYAQEWRQVFDESWRQMRDFFYVENMHGLDWKKIHDKYSVMVPYVKQRADLTYLIGEMIAELSIGHSYVNSGEKPEPDRIKIGLLGAKLSKDASGYFRIDKILQGANWDKSLRSPLTEVGMNVKEGEFILAVDGNPTNTMNDIYYSLIGKNGKEVELTINSTAGLQGSRKVIVTPIDDEANLYYFNWVQNNIKKVNEATNGQIGYIHIPDMSAAGLNEFAKYFYPQLNKKGLIIDDRGNGGGNVSPMIIERLSRQVTRATMMRNLSVPRSVPSEMMLGPKVMLIDNYSASDGDLFPYAFKKHALGKVIGMRTWGGVVGISGSLPFIDGSDLRKPEFASYSSEESKWIIEGHGVDPDIVVDNDPSKEYWGEDTQLNKAIEVILEEVKDYKGLPPIPPAPDKSK